MARDHARTGTALRVVEVGAAAVGALVAAGGAAVATYPKWRPWCVNWGATDDEAQRELPGDGLVGDPDLVTTRAIAIAAPPDAVWPWLAQMGPGRGGVYTYDWIENLLGLGVHSVDDVVPEYQHLAVGDAQYLGDSGPVLRAAVVDPGEAMVLRSDDGHWSWAFVLVATGAGTRLISRNRIVLPQDTAWTRWFYTYAMEPGSLVMERKMLLGIKERAERLAGRRSGEPVAA
ncbi:MAG TPA: hypothetical protein VII96_06185 [Acidimicrobiales bacterium]